MKKMFRFSGTALTAVLSTAAFTGLAGVIVYDNSKNLTGQSYYSANEFGDEIVLSSSSTGYRMLESFKFDFYLSQNASGNELVRLRLYKNDGTPVQPGNIPSPGTELTQGLNLTTALTPGNNGYGSVEFRFDLYGPTSITLPDRFTWTVSFSGIESGEQAGLVISSPATVGTSFNDMWEKSGGNWQIKNLEGTPYSFSAQITAVPEPTTVAYGILGGLGLIGYLMRRKLS